MEILMPGIGIRSSSCLNDAGIFTKEQLPFIKKVGFNLVELNLNHPWTGLDYKNELLISELCREAERNSVRLTAHAPTEIPLTTTDKTDDARIIEIYIDMAQKIAGAGIEGLVIHPCRDIQSCKSTDTEEIQMENFICRMEKIMPVCEKMHATLLLETMIPGRISSLMDNLIRVVDNVNSPFLKICLDTNHLNLSEDICAAAERAGERIGEFHLNDNHGIKEEHLLPYSGTIDWDAFTRMISRIAFEGNMILEPSRLMDGTQYIPENAALMLKQAKRAADRILNSLSAILCNK